MVVIVIILSNNFYWSILDLQCCANFSCTANIYRLFFFFFFFLTCVSPYRVLSRVPCAYSRSLLVIYFIYSTLAWKIPWTEEPGRLQSMGSRRAGHDWATSLSLLTFMNWRRKWQSTPVFLPAESQGRGSLVGCHLWGCTESDATEVT